MAQYFANRLDALAFPGAVIDTPNGVRQTDADFYSRAPYALFESNRTTTATSALILEGITAADVDLILRYRFLRDGTDGAINTGPGVLFRWQDINNHLYVATHSALTSTTFRGIYKYVNGTQTWLQQETLAQTERALRQWAYLRVQFVAGQARYKTWNEGSAEPGTWVGTITPDVADAPASGKIGIRCRSSGCIYEYDSLAIGTEGDAPPTAPTRVLSGTVKDPAGNPLARTVRAYRREIGALLAETLSDAGTGAFQLAVPHPGAYSVVALDEDEGAENALIFDRITPA